MPGPGLRKSETASVRPSRSCSTRSAKGRADASGDPLLEASSSACARDGSEGVIGATPYKRGATPLELSCLKIDSSRSLSMIASRLGLRIRATTRVLPPSTTKRRLDMPPVSGRIDKPSSTPIPSNSGTSDCTASNKALVVIPYPARLCCTASAISESDSTAGRDPAGTHSCLTVFPD